MQLQKYIKIAKLAEKFKQISVHKLKNVHKTLKKTIKLINQHFTIKVNCAFINKKQRFKNY